MKVEWGVSVVAWLLVAAGCASWRQRVPPEPPRRPVLAIESRSLPMLDNGLRVVVVPDSRAMSARVTLVVLAGRGDDPPGRHGLAHVVAVLTAIAQERRAMWSELEALATRGSEVTGFETTWFSARVDPPRLVEVLRLEGARLAADCDAWTDELFAHARELVRNDHRERAVDEVRALASLPPDRREVYLHRQRAYSRNDDAGLAQLTRGEACAFFRERYTPSNAVLIVSGNVTPDDVAAALPATLGRVPARQAAPRPPIAAGALRPLDGFTAAGLRRAAFLAWPLPGDATRARQLRAAVMMLAAYGRGHAESTLAIVEHRSATAHTAALVVAPQIEGSLDDVLKNVEAARTFLADRATSDDVDWVRARAVYEAMAELESDHKRDRLIAEHVLAGRDPARALRDELDALLELSRDELRELLSTSLAQPSITKLHHSLTARAQEHGEVAVAAVANAVEPGAVAATATPAHAPEALASAVPMGDPFAGAHVHSLRNGLTVVLLPLSSVPTVDARIVLPAGWGDDPHDRLGVAEAASMLEPRSHDSAFVQAGAIRDVVVGRDHTSLVVRGLAGDIDRLLSHLARTLRGVDPDGLYRAHYLPAVAVEPTWDAGLGRWYAALYGEDHPYTRAMARVAVAKFFKVYPADVHAFRRAHYRPGGATLVVAGGFDVDIAQRWIDHLFGGWSGAAPPAAPAAIRAVPRAAAFARERPGPLVELTLAFPIDARGAAGLVAGAMLASLASEVRTRLAASYSLTADLDQSRRSSSLRVAGYVAADRAADALALIRDGLRDLATDESRFAAAQRRVLADLASLPSGARDLASLAELAIRRGGLAASSAAAADARTLTLATVAALLRDLDLDRAAILMTGPRLAVTAAFAAAGRTPVFVESDGLR